MTTLTDEMLAAVTLEFHRFPQRLLETYRNPPGRKPNEVLLRQVEAMTQFDDETAEALIRDVVDAVVFQVIYLMGVGFKADLDVAISREDECEHLNGSVLHERYRAFVDPGGIPHRES